MEKVLPFQRRKAWTNLAEATSNKLDDAGKILITDYELFRIVWDIYDKRSAKNLRGAHPSKQTFTRTRYLLREEGIIRPDQSYSSLWRVMSVPEAPADTIVCQADPYCYISHMSAMQKYGLTNRRPEALFITSPTDATARIWNKGRVKEHFSKSEIDEDTYLEPLFLTRHPSKVRRRLIEQVKTKFYGDWKHVRGKEERLASIGQVFLDMLESPQRCGGMRHVLAVWSKHASKYLDQIIEAVEAAGRPIWKVRAGYILDEYLGISDARALSWQQHAQRGGSRVLEPGREYKEPFSEKWMLSINVG